MNKCNTLIWGVGKGFQNCLDEIMRRQMTEINIIGVSDKSSKIQDLPFSFIPNDNLHEIKRDIEAVIVTSNKYYDDIKSDIVSLGIDESKIISIALIKFFTNKTISEILGIKKRKISIMANNCWGGLMYHTLDMQFYSPLINMAVVKDDDYLKLVSNLDYYMSLQVKEVGEKYNNVKNFYYPVGRIDDITLDFIHYNSFEEAQKAWNKRKDRINYNDLLLMMYSVNKESIEKFCNIGIKAKIIFTPFKTDNLNAVCLEMKEQHKYFWEAVLETATGDYKIDKLEAIF